MKFKESISIIIPAYNDEDIIQENVEEVLSKLHNLFDDFELVLIDDASTDSTKDIIEKLVKKYKNSIKPIYHTKNLGVGSGIRNGIKAATKEYIMNNCSDLPFDIDDLKDMMPLVKKKQADGCIVIRKDRSANSLYRKITSYVNYLIIKVLFRLPIKDFQFVQLYKSEIVKDLKIEAKDIFVPPEIIIKLYDSGAKLIQFKSVFHKRQGGEVYRKDYYGSVKHLVRTFLDQIKFFIKLRLIKNNGSK